MKSFQCFATKCINAYDYFYVWMSHRVRLFTENKRPELTWSLLQAAFCIRRRADLTPMKYLQTKQLERVILQNQSIIHCQSSQKLFLFILMLGGCFSCVSCSCGVTAVFMEELSERRSQTHIASAACQLDSGLGKLKKKQPRSTRWSLHYSIHEVRWTVWIVYRDVWINETFPSYTHSVGVNIQNSGALLTQHLFYSFLKQLLNSGHLCSLFVFFCSAFMQRLCQTETGEELKRDLSKGKTAPNSAPSSFSQHKCIHFKSILNTQ